ncbi:MAG: ATP-binding protein [Micrococcales bacterium]|nr:ATP-binding protein [Micrococcales bacterium]
MSPNPFTPSAGSPPPLLVGRQDELDAFEEALDDGPGSPGRLGIFTGARGVGKTVMLTEIGELALRHGWVTIAETALAGLIDRLTIAVTDHIDTLGSAPSRHRSVTGAQLPFNAGGITVSDRPAAETGLRSKLGRLLDLLDRRETGLLITVDEVHRSAREDLRSLAATFQHLVREERNIALVMAGLPSSVSGLLSDEVLTFLRRADPHPLAEVSLAEVEEALQHTIADSGRRITDNALEMATAATDGYPFLIQLVGYHCWRHADGETIDLPAAQAGVAAARRRLGATVHAPALADLSAVDRTFLLAMSKDNGPSRTSDITTRLQVTKAYTSVYRARLIDAGVIEPVARGTVDFAIPYLREYLREHAATIRTHH